MEKVYLLLRSNRQIGPHSAEELAGLNLQATDLVWIEGKSTAWVYPQEVAELRPLLKNQLPAEKAAQTQHEAYLPGAKEQNGQKEKKDRHVFVSLPQKAPAPQPVKEAAATVQSLEAKAEALRQRAQACAATLPEASPAQQAAPLTDEADQYIARVIAEREQKAKKTLLYSRVAVAAVLLLLVGGFIIAKNVFKPHGEQEEAFINTSRAQEVPVPEVKDTEQAIAALPEPSPEALQTAGGIPQPRYSEEKSSGTPPKAVRVKNTMTDAKELPATTAAVKKSGPRPEETLRENKKEAADNSSQPTGTTAAEPVKEKKTLAQKLNRFFDKLKPKQEENPVAEGSSAKTQEEAGERQTRRRGEETGAASKPDLTQFIDISSNEAADKFMAGIHGLELTVRNRSNETVKSGAVEVRYYNDNKELIDKRTVSFASIPPNKKITLKAPDHRLADYTDYKLVTVN